MSGNNVDDPIDVKRRDFLTSVFKLSCTLPFFGALVPSISSCLPGTKERKSNQPVKVDVSRLKPGQQMTVVWQGKPIWIIHRTKQMLSELRQNNLELRDPDSLVSAQPLDAKNPYRSIRPEYLVLIGICTHLGCIPLFKPENQGEELYCPCHGSRFDLAGRVYKHVPAPINLEVPPYRWVENTVIEIGTEHE